MSRKINKLFWIMFVTLIFGQVVTTSMYASEVSTDNSEATDVEISDDIPGQTEGAAASGVNPAVNSAKQSYINSENFNWLTMPSSQLISSVDDLYDTYGVELAPTSIELISGNSNSTSGDNIRFTYEYNADFSDIAVRYGHAGEYRGQEIDIILSVDDYDLDQEDVDDIETGKLEKSDIYIDFMNAGNVIEINMDGFNWIDFNAEVVKAGTDTPYNITYLSKLNDVDISQYFGINPIDLDTVYASEDTKLNYALETIVPSYGGDYDVYVGGNGDPSNVDDLDTSFIYQGSGSDVQFRFGHEFGGNAIYLMLLRLAPPPETTITKDVVDTNNDGKVECGESLEYKVSVTNSSDDFEAVDVAVRDSLLEDLPEYLSWDGNVIIDPAIDSNGNLEDGTFQISSIAPGQTVTLSYSLVFDGEKLEDETTIENVVTDNGEDPEGECTSETATGDCDATSTPAVPKEPEVVESEVVESEIESETTNNSLAVTGSRPTLMLFVLVALLTSGSILKRKI